MEMTLENFKIGLAGFLYLWTRDAEMPVNQETEDYILGQLRAIKGNPKTPVFSDLDRAAMVAHIMEVV